MLVGWVSTPKRQENFLSHLLAGFDIRTNVRAIVQQGASFAIRVLVVCAAALISKVGTGIAASLIWELVHKTNGNDIDAAVGAEVGKTLLIWSLTL